ncbi:MAG: hypothetical protein MK110_15435 [Fuerstiella sp.]|nr:hypothetical protein [Fuerstiella sp.]
MTLSFWLQSRNVSDPRQLYLTVQLPDQQAGGSHRSDGRPAELLPKFAAG